MKTTLIACAGLFACTHGLPATEFHVAITGKDSNPGSADAPFRNIQRGADLAQAGDVITVHAGVYRERIDPPRGGDYATKRIVYQAAPGEKVEIKGSEVVKNWEKVQDDVWKVTLPKGYFGGFNPFTDLIHGDWFTPKGRQHHTGAVYLNGDWLMEAAQYDDVFKPGAATPLWFAKVDDGKTTIWAQFKGGNPNEQLTEINVRQTVFYPSLAGRNFITVRGFTLRQAATPWAPPTAEQIGLIGTHWSKGWLIENNVVSHSACSGIALGKHGDQWDNTSANSATGYVKTIERAQLKGWNKDTIGHHVVRNNTISFCEQTGIVGSLGCSFSTITGNTIHHIHVRQLFAGAEQAGIKLHGAIDVVINRNHIYQTCRGLWLDWMAQGTQVSANLFHDNQSEDLFVEVNHGPFLVDNNIFLSPTTVKNVSEGGAYVHNLIAGSIVSHPEPRRETPFHKAHSTDIAGLRDTAGGDDRFYNNLLVQNADLSGYDTVKLPVWMSGNLFLKGAKPSKHETAPVLKPDAEPAISLVEKADGFYLAMTFDPAWAAAAARPLVTTERLGLAAIPKLPYEKPDGSPLRIATDFFDHARNPGNPTPGPFETPASGKIELKVW